MSIGERYFFVKTTEEIRKIYLGDIICAESDVRRLKISTATGKLYIGGRMRDLQPLLDERFLRCHQSYAFNMDKIERMAKQIIYLETGIQITLGRESFRKARKLFTAYLGDQKIKKS